MDVTTEPVHLEQTTAFALEEKSKLVKSLRRFDMVLFTVCAFVGLDTLGTVASYGPQGFLWLVVLGVVFVLPYALLMAEAGSTFAEEGGPYEWMKLAWGRLAGGIGAVFYWISNPLWVGGSLAFLSTEAWRKNVSGIGEGTFGDYTFKLAFIWISIGVAIASLRYGKWIPNLGAALRFLTLGCFSVTVVIYGARHGFHGFSGHDSAPTRGVFIALVPVLLFNYVGFELQNGAAEEMENPHRDVPVSVFQAAMLGMISYIFPVLGILLVLPLDKVTGIGGFIEAVTEVFTVYGGAAHPLLIVMTIGFIGSLLTSGAVWMIGSDRVQAVAALDGAFWSWFGVFNRKLGTPVRVNVMSGVVATAFCTVALEFFNGGADSTFGVVLDIALSTTLISYILVFPAILKLRYTHADVHRPYAFPFGKVGIWIGTIFVTLFIVLGSWAAVFPSTLERLIGVEYGSFKDRWGVSQLKFEAYALGTLGVIVLIAIAGYIAAAPNRRRMVDVPID
ncbi:MAG: APC family permease [Actinomycetes bacterium]